MTDSISIVSYGQLASILRARWQLIAKTTVVVVGLVLVASFVLPKRYTATASVLVDGRARDPLEESSSNALSIPGYLATQVGLIKSERISLRVIHDLHLDADPETKKLWLDESEGRGDYSSWLAVRLQKKLDVKPSRDSSIIDIGFTAPTPALAKSIANAFLRAYVDTTLELRTGPSKNYSDFFDARGKVARAELERTQTKLSSFQRANGILATDERFDVETARLTDLTARLAGLQANEDESTSRRAEASINPQNMPELMSNNLVGGLSADLSRQESALKSLSSRLGDNNPQVREARASINELKQRIADETKRMAGSLGVNERVNNTRLKQLEAALAQQRTKVLKLKEVRDEASVLQRDVENAQHAYDNILARASQTALASESTQTNVSVVKEATEPGEVSFPKPLLNSVVAVFLGLMFGVIAAVVRELRDRRLYTAEDVVRGLKQPVLFEMPVVSMAQRIKLPNRPKDMRSRIIGSPLLTIRPGQSANRS